MSIDDVQRFWANVNQTDDGCWNWIGDKDSGGCGKFERGGAHRYAYTLYHGCVPDGLWILHHCDNPACVRREHLYAGTAKDNAMDRMRRGRSAHTLETRAKISERTTIALASTEVRANMRAMQLGRKHSLESCIKRSALLLGNQNSKGHMHTLETRTAMSESARQAWQRRKTQAAPAAIALSEEEQNGSP